MSTMDYVVMRVIDANLNRAREALRVMEEYARFGMDDASLSGAIKETRHELARAVGRFAPGLTTADAQDETGRGESARAEARGSGSADSLLIRSRDIVGDVGREVTTAAEYKRSNAAQVALAAGKRLSEALRAIEEYGKALDPAFAFAVEKIRYRGYELERRLTITTEARARLAHVRLYVIITESLCGADWFATAEAALRGGADCLQLREKDIPDREFLERAKRLMRLCHDNDALLIINDRPDIAVLSGADGIHLGQDDLPAAAARRILPPSYIVGISTHTIAQVEDAAAEAPDYIAVGPMFSSGTKPQDHIAGPETLSAACRLTSLPLVPIGGIDERNAGEVLAAGACRLCVCAAVVAQQDVSGAVSRLRAMVKQSLIGPVTGT